jgi:hypothetical protein
MTKEQREILRDFLFSVALILVIVLCIVIVASIIGCEDSCDTGEMSCQGSNIVICVSGGWEEHKKCGEVINFDLELTTMLCCPVEGAPEMMECRESCE